MMIASGGSRRMCASVCARVKALRTQYPWGARMLARERLVHSCSLAMRTPTGRADGGALRMLFLSGQGGRTATAGLVQRIRLSDTLWLQESCAADAAQHC